MPTEAAKFAEDYGYQLAFLKSDAGLYKIFQQAMKGDWDSTKFVAAVKNSPWYKTHSESYRTKLSQKTMDPASWAQDVAGQRASIGAMAHQMGSPVPSAAMAKITEDSLMFGWNDAQIHDHLARYVSVKSTAGEAGNILQKLKQTAYRNGITVSDSYLNTMLQQVSVGTMTVDSAQQAMRNTFAKSLAPGFAKELDQGVDLYDIASPYMQSMAQTLELSPSSVDLFDPTIRKALASGTPGPDGKPGNGGSTPLWQFEQNLRQDPRYMKTKKAQDSTMSVGHQVLKDLGMVGQ